MFENIMKFFKKLNKKEEKEQNHSRDAAKERLHLVLMQDRANVSADFLELMKQEIIEVIKKYIDVDERAIDVRLTNKENDDGTNGAPALYANIPILNIKNEASKVENKKDKKEEKKEKKKEDKKKTEKVEEQEEKKDDKEERKDIENIEPPIGEIQNERIAKVILESGKFNQENNDKKKSKKKGKKEEINQVVEENETEENKQKAEELEQKEIENTKEELKSED